jgi:cytochrome c-type biogenesis protein CcmH
MKQFVFILALLFCMPAFAVDGDEVMLPNPQAEAEARLIMRDLRCLVCRNESIVDSHADLARDLRVIVRERVAAGDTPDEVRAFMVARYGEWVLLSPQTRGLNLVLWIIPVGIFAIGFWAWRRRVQPGILPNSED